MYLEWWREERGEARVKRRVGGAPPAASEARPVPFTEVVEQDDPVALCIAPLRHLRHHTLHGLLVDRLPLVHVGEERRELRRRDLAVAVLVEPVEGLLEVTLDLGDDVRPHTLDKVDVVHL